MNNNQIEKNWFQKTVDCVEDFFLNIFRKIGLVKFVNWYIEHQEGMRYLIFGALSTLINIVTFSIFAKIFKTSSNLSNLYITIISNIIAWIVAVFFAYVTNKLSVFNSKANNLKDLVIEMLYFFGARIFTLIIETAFLNIFITKLQFNVILMKIISNIIVIIINFILSKLLIFKKS